MRRQQNTIQSAVLILLDVGALLFAGCATPTPEDSVSVSRGGGARVAGVTPQRANDAEFAARLAEQRAALRRCLPGDDLLESLYFDWMSQPYRRASLAVAVKTVAVLGRELELRQRGAGDLSDRDVAAMLDWLEGVHAGAWTARVPAFQPQRIDVRNWKDAAGDDEFDGLALFAIADRATATRRDERYGDFDILAGTGFRICVAPTAPSLYATDSAAMSARADGLDIALIEMAATGADAVESAEAGRLQPVTLSQMLAGELPEQGFPAVIDPPGGESVFGMLARRQLLRGVTGGAAFAGVGLGPLGVSPDSPKAVRAAMWLQAVSGQRLGVLEGWRDARDGSRTPYRSRLADPAHWEMVAHTALDLLRHRDAIAACWSQPKAALAIDREHLARDDANAFAPAFLHMMKGIHTANVPFDLLPAERPAEFAGYAIVVVAPSLDRAPTKLTVYRGSEESSVGPLHYFDEDHGPCSRQVGGHIAKLLVTHFQGEIDAGPRTGPIFSRASTDGRTMLFVNPEAFEVLFELDSAFGADTVRGRPWTDLFTGERIEARVTMAPWQVRLLSR